MINTWVKFSTAWPGLRTNFGCGALRHAINQPRISQCPPAMGAVTSRGKQQCFIYFLFRGTPLSRSTATDILDLCHAYDWAQTCNLGLRAWELLLVAHTRGSGQRFWWCESTAEICNCCRRNGGGRELRVQLTFRKKLIVLAIKDILSLRLCSCWLLFGAWPRRLDWWENLAERISREGITFLFLAAKISLDLLI